ncbi:MAG TPA: hypothetical protein VIM57_09760 [Luteolibacter sp.]
MRKRFLVLSLISCHVWGGVNSQVLREAFSKKLEAFDSIALTGDGKTTRFEMKLGETPVMIDGEPYDGFRFKCPEIPEGSDFIWYFNAPRHWAHWSILRVEPGQGGGFENWLWADRVFEGFDKPGEKDRVHVMQTLERDYFKPGAEYILWFHKKRPGDSAQDLRLVTAFAKSGSGGWSHEQFRTALGLQESSPEAQIEALDSRGGRILLDARLFDHGYALERIRSMLFYRSYANRSGFASALKASSAPGKAPSLKEIVEKYGAPDFVRDSDELARFAARKGETAVSATQKITYYHYDRFAFGVETNDETRKVVKVDTSSSNFADLRPPEKGNAFASLELEHLNVFYQDGKEAGRAYFFMEGASSPLFIETPPPGEYHSENLVLLAKGGGEWVWKSFYPNGQVSKRQSYRENLLDGESEIFYQDGRIQRRTEYRKGLRHGELKEFDPQGQVTYREKFENGRPVGDPDGEDDF